MQPLAPARGSWCNSSGMLHIWFGALNLEAWNHSRYPGGDLFLSYCCLIYLPCIANLRELYSFLCPSSSMTEETSFIAITVWNIVADYAGPLWFRFSGLSQYHLGLNFFKEKYGRKVLRKVIHWLQALHAYSALCQPELNLVLQSSPADWCKRAESAAHVPLTSPELFMVQERQHHLRFFKA